MATLSNYVAAKFPEAVTHITKQYQEACRDENKVRPGYWAIMDLISTNREANQGEG
jgi:hypothetical protein